MYQLIEFNEANFDVINKYVQKYPGEYPGFEKLLSSYKMLTSSEEQYEHIEPWIQWVSAHTNRTFQEHRVFRLGDIITYPGEQIFEILEKRGLKVGCLSAMNAKNNLRKPSYFIPDPWTDTTSDQTFLSRNLHRVLKQTVNDNSTGKISFFSGLFLVYLLIFKTDPKNILLYFSLFKKRKKKWNKALFLDLLISDIYFYLNRARKPDFSCVFFNGLAHVQHHYFLNSEFYDGDVKNEASYISENDDPIKDALSVYDKIFQRIAHNGGKVLIATGLRQVPVPSTINYYRLKDHASFLKKLGINFAEIHARMTRDFLIYFKDNKDLENALNKLANLSVNDIKIFEEIEVRDSSLFVTLTYAEKIMPDTIIELPDSSIDFYNSVVFVAAKNGEHDQQGYVYANYPFAQLGHHVGSNAHVKDIALEVLAANDCNTRL